MCKNTKKGAKNQAKKQNIQNIFILIRTVYLKNKLLMNLYMLTFILCSKMATVKIYLYKKHPI